MTVFLIGYRSDDDWFDDRVILMPELGYFDTLEEAQAWLAAGSFVKKEYDEEVQRITNSNNERHAEYQKNVSDWEAAQAAGLGHLVSEPVEFYEFKIDTYDEFARGWNLEPVPVERAV